MEPLTDEELAAMVPPVPFILTDQAQGIWRAGYIAALRASREEVERLKGYDHAAFFSHARRARRRRDHRRAAVRAAAAGPCADGRLSANTC